MKAEFSIDAWFFSERGFFLSPARGCLKLNPLTVNESLLVAKVSVIYSFVFATVAAEFFLSAPSAECQTGALVLNVAHI